MEVGQYLQRIGIKEAGPPSYPFLARLQNHHMCAAPFENLDVMAGRPVVLDLPHLYDKIVRRRRGGFCYELNGLFAWLLGQLGYDVTLLSAGVYDEASGKFGAEFDHMTLLVQVEQPYLVDVGFGDSTRKPIPLPDGSVEDVSGRYRVRPPREGSHRFVLERYTLDAWRPQHQFTLQPRALTDYIERCHYQQTHPDSVFLRGNFCTLATQEGRVTLSERQLTITRNGFKEKTAVTSPLQTVKILQNHFGMEWGGGGEANRAEVQNKKD